MTQPAELYVATYHYVRDLPNTRFPRIKGMMLDAFREQVSFLAGAFEMATLQSAMAYLRGDYTPKRHLCLMTFDDGLREHYADVTPILADHGAQGLFFVITACLEEGVVAPVHMNHFLTADLGFERYRDLFHRAMSESELANQIDVRRHATTAQRTYPLDQPDVAEFKYLFNFLLPSNIRDNIVRKLFAEHLGSEGEFAANLYLNWSEARQMQDAGMVIGGHTHTHRPLSSLDDDQMEHDLQKSRLLMNQNLKAQDLWPFSYPYGKKDSYNEHTVALLKKLGYCCALTTESGQNLPGIDAFAIHRLDGQHHPTLKRPAANSLNREVTLPA